MPLIPVPIAGFTRQVSSILDKMCLLKDSTFQFSRKIKAIDIIASLIRLLTITIKESFKF